MELRHSKLHIKVPGGAPTAVLPSSSVRGRPGLREGSRSSRVMPLALGTSKFRGPVGACVPFCSAEDPPGTSERCLCLTPAGYQQGSRKPGNAADFCVSSSSYQPPATLGSALCQLPALQGGVCAPRVRACCWHFTSPSLCSPTAPRLCLSKSNSLVK